MNSNTICTKILTDETLQESVSHGSSEYPFRYYLEDIWQFDFHCIDWHWHPEIEFVFVEKGSATFLIGSNRYTLTEGNGIFINTQIIHRFETTEHTVIPNIVFSPALLASEESLIYRKYIQPVLNSPVDCQIYSPDVPWQKELLTILLSIFALQNQENPSEIQTVQRLLLLWDIIYSHIKITDTKVPAESKIHSQALLQIMMQYIHTCYQQKISLEAIAQTVNISKSSALHIFNSQLHITPVNYLIQYRLKCAAKLLNETDGSVSSIAQKTGFENTGYFCRKFKKLFQMTPSEYRKKSQNC